MTICWAIDGFYMVDFMPGKVSAQHMADFQLENSGATFTPNWQSLGYMPFITNEGTHMLIGYLYSQGYPQCYVTKHAMTGEIVLFEPNSNRMGKVPDQLVFPLLNMKGSGYDTILIENILDSDA